MTESNVTTTTHLTAVPFRLPRWAVRAIMQTRVAHLDPDQMHAVNDLTREAARIAADNGADHWHWRRAVDAQATMSGTNDMPGQSGKEFDETEILELVLGYNTKSAPTPRTFPVTEAI